MGVLSADALDCHDIAPSHERERNQTTIDRAITTFAASVAVDDRDGTSPAIAFRAAFLRTGEATSAQPLQQSDIGRDRIDPNGFSVEAKFKRTIHAKACGALGAFLAVILSEAKDR